MIASEPSGSLASREPRAPERGTRLSRPFNKVLGRQADPSGENFMIKGLRGPERVFHQKLQSGSLTNVQRVKEAVCHPIDSGSTRGERRDCVCDTADDPVTVPHRFWFCEGLERLCHLLDIE